MLFKCKIALTCWALHGLVILLYMQMPGPRTSEISLAMFAGKSSFDTGMDMFDVSLQTDELGETSTTLVTHKVFSLLVNGLDMQFEAMRAHNGFGTVRTWDLHVLLVMAS